jgi:hypothetical protein
LDAKTFAEKVIAEVYKRTLEDKLVWKVDKDSMKAEPTDSIHVRVRFEDKGPASAKWTGVTITNPVGSGITFFDHPKEPVARLAPFEVSQETLSRLDQLFEKLVLEPRRKRFESAMAELIRD